MFMPFLTAFVVLIIYAMCVFISYVGSFEKKPRVDTKWTGTGIEIVSNDKLILSIECS